PALRSRVRRRERALPVAVRAARHRAGIRLDAAPAAPRRLPARGRALALGRAFQRRAVGRILHRQRRRGFRRSAADRRAQGARARRAAAGIGPPHQGAAQGDAARRARGAHRRGEPHLRRAARLAGSQSGDARLSRDAQSLRTLALLLVLAAPAYADLYRWVDAASGSVKFSNLPPADARLGAEVVRSLAAHTVTRT